MMCPVTVNCGRPTDCLPAGHCVGEANLRRAGVGVVELVDLVPQAERRTEVKGLELTDNEAYALAQLCKRITWSDCMTLSVDRDECQLQINATNLVRAALARQGWGVR